MTTPAPVNFESIFKNGTDWFRADFHLHTKEDRQFDNPPGDIRFEEAYVERLKSENISLGLITNHNKFIQDEFKRLRKQARKNEILLLPGVELGVQGGSGGIHMLVCFDPVSWIDNKENCDFINRFLDTAFEQVPNRESEDTNCQWTLSQVLKKLDEHRINGRDSFVIMAHVDENKGVLREMGGSLSSHVDDVFKKSVLGFQKVRSRDHWNHLKTWVGCDWEPAKVEGSDCKSLEAVGVAHQQNDEAKECWMKLGALSFDAVKLALQMKDQRISGAKPPARNAYIRSLTLEGKLIKKQHIELSPDMTNLIGIRGSGKSSLIECIRYALDVRLSEQTDGPGYKENLVERTLGGGGKITLELIDPHGDTYIVERICGDSPKVSRSGEYIPNLRPNSSSLIQARYFGQKDLVTFSEKKFATELVGRFTQNENEGQNDIHLRVDAIEQRILHIEQSRSQLQQQEELESQLAEANEILKKFEKHHLGEKLKKQIAWEKDLKHGKELVDYQADSITSLQSWLDEDLTFWKGLLDHESASKAPEFLDLMKSFEQFVAELESIHGVLKKLENTKSVSEQKLKQINLLHESQKEAFAEIRRELSLPGDLSPDTYITMSKKKTILDAKLKEIAEVKKKRETHFTLLHNDLKDLQDLWHKQFQKKMAEIDRLNEYEGSLKIDLKFKQDKQGFQLNLKSWISGLQGKTLEKIANHFSDGIELYRDLRNKAVQLEELGLSRDQITKVNEGVLSHWFAVLTSRPGDSVELSYKGKSLHDHSLGQRATALMMFLLNQKEFDLLIVDQPEDDLDNQTLYTEVIQRLLELKGEKQIIFATHSPNIPVLGDAEQMLCCQYSPEAITIQTGTIDSPSMQKEIVNVMEGGDDAFRKRKQIYESWNH